MGVPEDPGERPGRVEAESSLADAAPRARQHLLLRPEVLAACQRLPKLELHAHLNGSVREETIRCVAPAACSLPTHNLGVVWWQAGARCLELMHGRADTT